MENQQLTDSARGTVFEVSRMRRTISNAVLIDSAKTAATWKRSFQITCLRCGGRCASILSSVFLFIILFCLATDAAASKLLKARPISINVGSVAVGSSSTREVTLINDGTKHVTISGATVKGVHFSISELSLPLTLAPRQSKTFKATFAPTAVGAVAGSISITSDATNSPATVSLSGSGATGVLSVTPTSRDFGNVIVGKGSSRCVLLANTGPISVTVSAVTVTGAGFSVSAPSLPFTVAVGQNRTLDVTFAPTAVGSVTGSVSIVSDASGSPATVSLSGTGVTTGLLIVTPSSTSFGNVVVGSNSVLPVFLANIGTDSVTITAATETGQGFSLSGLSLPLTLTVGQKTSFTVTFAPTVTGSATGNVTLTSDATDTPTNEPLSGMGVNSHSVQLAWAASTSKGISGYNVYRGTVSGGPYTIISSSVVPSTAYTDNTAGAGQTYYYVNTAVNSSGVESAYSNETSAVVPLP